MSKDEDNSSGNEVSDNEANSETEEQNEVPEDSDEKPLTWKDLVNNFARAYL